MNKIHCEDILHSPYIFAHCSQHFPFFTFSENAHCFTVKKSSQERKADKNLQGEQRFPWQQEKRIPPLVPLQRHPDHRKEKEVRIDRNEFDRN